MHDPRNARNAVIGPDTSACRWRWNSASAIPSVGYCIDAARVAGLRAGKDRNTTRWATLSPPRSSSA